MSLDNLRELYKTLIMLQHSPDIARRKDEYKKKHAEFLFELQNFNGGANLLEIGRIFECDISKKKKEFCEWYEERIRKEEEKWKVMEEGARRME